MKMDIQIKPTICQFVSMQGCSWVWMEVVGVHILFLTGWTHPPVFLSLKSM